MNSVLTVKIDVAGTAAAKTATAAAKTAGPARIARTLACKWDMLAVVSLMASSAVYGIYALTQMTGF